MNNIRNELHKRAQARLQHNNAAHVKAAAVAMQIHEYIEKSGADAGLVARAMDVLRRAAAPIGADISAVGKAVGGTAKGLYNRGAKDIAKGVGRSVKNTATGAAGKVRGAASGAVDKVRGAASGAAGKVRDTASAGYHKTLTALEENPRLRAAVMGAGGAGVGAGIGAAAGDDENMARNAIIGALLGGAGGYAGGRAIQGLGGTKSISEGMYSPGGSLAVRTRDFEGVDPLLNLVHKLRPATV